MPRRYNVSFEKVSVSAVQDLITIQGASGKMCRILEVSVWDVDTTAPTNTQLALRCSILTATVTVTGGTSVTPRPLDVGDAAASFTAKSNNTTQATTTGAKTTVREAGANVYQGDQYQFLAPPLIGPSESFVYEIITAPAAALTLSGNIVVEELGG